MIILTDSREQHPFSFTRWPDIQVQTATLPCGDYSLPAFEDRAAIERKELNDLVNCFMGENRTRFEKELARARRFELFTVVVEAGLEDLAKGNYRSNMKPQSALQTTIAFYIRYSIPFMFCGSRAGAEYMTYSLLNKFIYEIGKRFKQVQAQGLNL